MKSLEANGWKEQVKRRIAAARGEQPGDLLLRGATVANVFTGELVTADVLVVDGYVAAVGQHRWDASEVIDVKGALVLPGLIDAHMHLESTLLTPLEFAKVAVLHGTTAVIADPHEIANVLGEQGVRQLLEASEQLPLDFFVMAPSCVPAAPWEQAGAELDAQAVARLLEHPRVLGLAEMMNFPGVLFGDEQVLDKLEAAWAAGRPVDGHAPGLVGAELAAYVSSGVSSDHESTGVEEALQKARLGMLVQVREGSSAKNLDTLLPLIREGRLGSWCLCTDDVHPDELLTQGHIDARLRRVIAAGVEPVKAVRHATLVPAQHYGLKDRGAVAPGWKADLIVTDSWEQLNIQMVVKNGRVVVSDGRLQTSWQAVELSQENTVRLGPVKQEMFELTLGNQPQPVIEVLPDQILTRKLELTVGTPGERWRFDNSQDLVLGACLERHRASGQVGLGLVKGFGLKRGALGSSVAHDSHNLVLVGTNSKDMLTCVHWLQQNGGGLVVVVDGAVSAGLPLPVAGLLSPEPADVLADQLHRLHEAARSLGCTLPNPFGTLSFLALSVIPELRLTCEGLFDAVQFRHL